MKKRTVIRVRYRKEDGSLSRPHRIQKFVTDNGSTVFTNMGTYWREDSKKEINTIDPNTFVTSWPNQKHKSKAPKAKTIKEVIRVKFWKKTSGANGLYRPTKVLKFTSGDEIVYRQYSTQGKYGKILDPKDFVLLGSKEWPTQGPRPTPKASRKYSKEQLKEWGYDDVLIAKIYENNFSSKDVNVLSKRTGLTREEARTELKKHGGVHKANVANKERIKEKKERITDHLARNIKIDGKWYAKTEVRRKYKPNSRRGRKMAAKGLPMYKKNKVTTDNKQTSKKKKLSKSKKRANRRRK